MNGQLVTVVAVLPADYLSSFEAAMPDCALIVTVHGDENETLVRLNSGQAISMMGKNLGKALLHDVYGSPKQ